MPDKKDGQVFSRIGKMLKILFLLCIAAVVIYFIVLLASGDFSKLKTAQNTNSNQISENIMGEVQDVNNDKLDLAIPGTGNIFQYTLTSSTGLEIYNPTTKLNESAPVGNIKPGVNAVVTYNKENNLVQKIVVLPFSISGDVSSNQAGVLTVKYMGNDYTIRTDPQTAVARQASDGSLENDLTISNVAVGDTVSTMANQAGKTGNYSFTAATISILPQVK